MTDKLNIFFLGTSSSSPTKTRNLTSALLSYRGVSYLFDTPENVQQQIQKVNQSILKIKHIFITHFHGDHYYGILGLLSSMSLNKREDDLVIYVPSGYKSFLENFLKSGFVQISFPLTIKEVKSNFKSSFENITISAVKLNHSILSFGYIFKIKDKIGKFDKKKALKLKIPEGPLFSKLQEGKSIKVNGKTISPKQVMDYSFKKLGKKILYFTDTTALKKITSQMKDADILIHECTFSDQEKLKAKERMHSYFSEVIDFSKKIKAKQTYLIHLSTRYKNKEEVIGDFKKSLKDVIFPNDLDVIETTDY